MIIYWAPIMYQAVNILFYLNLWLEKPITRSPNHYYLPVVTDKESLPGGSMVKNLFAL